MYQLKDIRCNIIPNTLGFLIVLWMISCFGCAPEHALVYHKNIIKNQLQEQPQPLWQYPSLSTLREVKGAAGLSGATRPQDVPSYMSFMRNVEPPFIVHMSVLSDGSLVCISPLELKHENKKFVFVNYYRENFTRVNVTLFDSEKGIEKWSREISGAGIFDIKEINTTLLFESKQFDNNGSFVESQLVALDRKSGGILWRRSFTKPFNHFSIAPNHNLIVFSMSANGNSNKGATVEAIDASTGKLYWTISKEASPDGKSEKNAWPILFTNGIILFEDGISYRNLPDGQVVWDRKDLSIEGIAQPEVVDEKVLLQSKQGLTALDVHSGKTVWTCSQIKEQVAKLVITDKHVGVAESDKGWFFESYRLHLLDPANGQVLWSYETEPILGNVVESKDAVFFSTKDSLIALDLKDGRELFKKELPWKDEFSSHAVSLRNSSVTVGNEWNVAMWDQKDGKLIYHHHFEPLCPIMTTEERMSELKAGGANVSATTASSLTYTSSLSTAYFQSAFQESIANYRSTGNDIYLSQAQMNYAQTRSSMATERAMTGMQFGLAVSSLIATVARTKIALIHSMVYPAIDSVIRDFRTSDTAEYVVRMVGVQVKDQRFSAIEILHIPTGQHKQILLSPYQMPSDLKTIGTSKMTATELNGYLPVSFFLHHTYSTVVDLQRKRIFHYGPGLNVDDYVYFNDTDFVRGRLSAFPLELPGGL
jgi:outer membrane protein assembly factor BamB